MSESQYPDADNPHVLLGAFILGGLADSERSAFETHVESCAACQAELESFAGLPKLLDLVPSADASALIGGAMPPISIALLDRIAQRRRRNRLLVAVGVAASVGIGILISPVFSTTPPPDASYTVQSGQGIRMDLHLNSKAWGTELSFSGDSLPKEGELSLWVVDNRGTVDRAGSWMATPNGQSKITGAVPTPLAKISTVQLRDTDNRVLAAVAMRDTP